MEMPSQEEQRIAAQYVLKRKLYRPNTSIKKAIRCCSIYLFSNLAFSLVSYSLLHRLGIFLLLPDPISNLYCNHPIGVEILFILLVFFATGIFCVKAAIIGAIRLYQRYAPEDIRRRCLFKPTCSEYAILAIEKYGVIIGLIKAYIRLFKKCRGNIYRIDYP